MNLLKEGKTNWKYILIVLILAIIVGGGILGYTKYHIKEIVSLTKFPEIEKPEEIEGEPYIKVVSPNRGEMWVIGNTYNVTWQSIGLEKIFIHLFCKITEGKTYGTFLTPQGIEANQGSYSWKLSKDLPVSDQCKIEIVYPKLDPGRSDQSDNYFSIVKEDETAKCSPIDFPDYEIAKEFKVDLNNDQKEEILRVYRKIANKYGERVGPIMVKIFSGTEDCPKETFSYQGKGNEVWGAQVFSNFWGDGSNAVMVQDASYGGGCGGTTRLIFLTYREEKYSVVEGPQFGGLGGLYMFDGENGLGKKIIVAEERWASDPSDYCCGCASRRQFMIYTWNGEGYTKNEARITQNKYSPEESIDEILEKEPSVLNPQ